MNINVMNNITTDTKGLIFKPEFLDSSIKDTVDSVMPSPVSTYEGEAFTHTVTPGNNSIQKVEELERGINEKAQMAKDNLTNLFNKLTTTDLKSADGMGLDNLWDKDIAETINVVEEIKIMLATYCEDYIPTGNIDVDAVKEIAGSAALAAKVMKKLNLADMPITKDNIADVIGGVKEYNSIKDVDENSKRYLIKNQLPPTIDNIYKAKHSGSLPGKGISQQDFANIEKQVQEILKAAGYSIDEGNITNARIILEENVALNKESMQLATDIDRLDLNMAEDEIIDKVITSLIEKGNGKSCMPLEEVSLKEKAINNSDILRNASILNVISIINANQSVTISNFSKEIENREFIKENELSYIKEYRSFLEARIVLSPGVFYHMEKLGIDTSNTPLNEMVETCVASDYVKETSLQVDLLKTMPINVLGIEMETFSINRINELGVPLKWELDRIEKAYDTFATEIRRDLGDNLNKAVNASKNEILDSFGLESTSENVASVKILAANNIELTSENVVSVAKDYEAVMDIVNNISPKMVLEMIRKGINPLTEDIHTLRERIDEFNKASEIEPESMAKFLYKLEQKGDITETERRDYIGMFKLLNTLKKEEAKSIGAVRNWDKEVTLENLITAYTSKKHSGMDKSIGEDKEFTQTVGEMAYFKNIFTQCEVMEKESMPNEYYESQLQNMSIVSTAEEEVIRLLDRNDLPFTVNNLLAAMDYKNQKVFAGLKDASEEIYEKATDILKHLESEEDLQGSYERLSEATKEYSKSVGEEADVTFERLQTAKVMVRNVSLVSQLSAKHQYQIPVELEDSLVNINLTLVKSDKVNGKMLITVEEGPDGKLSIMCQGKENSIDALIISDNQEQVELMKSRKDAIIERLVEIGFGETSVSIGEADELLSLEGEGYIEGNVATRKLYEAAKIFISQLITK